jgi:hypothetical protein
MLLFSFVFVSLNAETEVVLQIPSIEILLILPSGEGPHFPWTRNHRIMVPRESVIVSSLVIRALCSRIRSLSAR